ncbi:MAG: hypothetical protein ACRESE_01165 [Gammaproteobacteria bacterium]
MNPRIRSNALFLAAAIGILCAPATFAHTVSNSYLTFQSDPGTTNRFHGQWDISLRDLNFVLHLDNNGDGQITWGELKGHQQQINDYAYKRLRITGDGHVCTIRPQKQWVDTHADGAYAVLFFNVDCPGNPQILGLDDRLLFRIDPTHRGILVFRDGADTSTALLSPSKHKIAIKLSVAGG